MASEILYLNATGTLGGAERFLLQCARLHDPEKYRPRFAVFQDGPLVNELRAAGAEVHVPPASPRLRKPWTLVATALWVQKTFGNKLSVIHSTMAYSALVGSILRERLSIPHVWYQHGPVGSWLDNAAVLSTYDAVLANSHFTLSKQRELATWRVRTRISAPLEAVVRPGVEMPAISQEEFVRRRYAWRTRWKIGENAFVAGLIGRFQKQKGIETFISAVKSASEIASEVRGVVVGSGEPAYTGELKKKAGASPVILAGRADAYDVMPAFDVIVSASIAPEGLGLTLMEGMSMGLPAIAPNEGGPVETISPGETGLLFEPRSTDALANAILQLALNPELRERLGDHAKAWAKTNFDVQSGIRSLESFYDRIISERS